jgi:hypothetical protein
MFDQIRSVEAPRSMPSEPSAEASNAKTALIAKQIEVLFSAYRRADYADPVGFVAQLGVVLNGYPEDVIVYATSPQTGVQRRHTFPPSIPEVVKACDDRMGELSRLAHAEDFAERKRETERLRLSAPPPSPRAKLSSMGNRLINAHEWATEFKGVRPVGRFEQPPAILFGEDDKQKVSG